MNIVLFLLQYCSMCKYYSLSTPVHQSGHRASELKLRKADTNINSSISFLENFCSGSSEIHINWYNAIACN